MEAVCVVRPAHRNSVRMIVSPFIKKMYIHKRPYVFVCACVPMCAYVCIVHTCGAVYQGSKGIKKRGKRKKRDRKYKNIDIRATIFATITIIVLKVEHMEAFGRGW